MKWDGRFIYTYMGVDDAHLRPVLRLYVCQNTARETVPLDHLILYMYMCVCIYKEKLESANRSTDSPAHNTVTHILIHQYLRLVLPVRVDRLRPLPSLGRPVLPADGLRAEGLDRGPYLYMYT